MIEDDLQLRRALLGDFHAQRARLVGHELHRAHHGAPLVVDGVVVAAEHLEQLVRADARAGHAGAQLPQLCLQQRMQTPHREIADVHARAGRKRRRHGTYVESEPSWEGVPSAFFDITMQAKTKLHDMSGGPARPVKRLPVLRLRIQFAAGGFRRCGAVQRRAPAAAGGATITGMENTRDTLPSSPSVSTVAVIMNTPSRAGISTS